MRGPGKLGLGLMTSQKKRRQRRQLMWTLEELKEDFERAEEEIERVQLREAIMTTQERLDRLGGPIEEGDVYY